MQGIHHRAVQRSASPIRGCSDILCDFRPGRFRELQEPPPTFVVFLPLYPDFFVSPKKRANTGPLVSIRFRPSHQNY
jgi:hypothetical protein